MCGSMAHVPIIIPLEATYVNLTFSSDGSVIGRGFEIIYKIVSREGLQYDLFCGHNHHHHQQHHRSRKLLRLDNAPKTFGDGDFLDHLVELTMNVPKS